MPFTENKGVRLIKVRNEQSPYTFIAVPVEGFLTGEQEAQAAKIGMIPGYYADGTVVKADGTIIKPPVP